MRVIHVLRKPLSEGTVASNVVKHGVGGLNIDASRIGSDAGWSYPNGAGGNGFHGGVGRPADGSRVEPVVSRGGRWPGNLILQHLDGCRCEGVKKVKSHNPDNKVTRGGASTGECYGDYGKRSLAGHADKDGKETIANWICVEGCPAARLDEQSGPGAPIRSRKGVGLGYSGGSRERGVEGYRDSGGASRFFKQVGGKTE
jgi:hypothetical protein